VRAPRVARQPAATFTAHAVFGLLMGRRFAVQVARAATAVIAAM
jgi:hypothetical protein